MICSYVYSTCGLCDIQYMHTVHALAYYRRLYKEYEFIIRMYTIYATYTHCITYNIYEVVYIYSMYTSINTTYIICTCYTQYMHIIYCMYTLNGGGSISVSS